MESFEGSQPDRLSGERSLDAQENTLEGIQQQHRKQLEDSGIGEIVRQKADMDEVEGVADPSSEMVIGMREEENGIRRLLVNVSRLETRIYEDDKTREVKVFVPIEVALESDAAIIPADGFSEDQASEVSKLAAELRLWKAADALPQLSADLTRIDTVKRTGITRLPRSEE